jgi:hypothetical protein
MRESLRRHLSSSDCGGGSGSGSFASAAREDWFTEKQEQSARSMLPAIREGVDMDGQGGEGEGDSWQMEREEGENEDDTDEEDNAEERGQVLEMKVHRPPELGLIIPRAVGAHTTR